jgi:hypothetical protein
LPRGNAGGPIVRSSVATIVAIVVIPFLLLLLCTAVSALLAQRKDAELNVQAPETLSYKWGYFLGYYGILFGILVALSGLVLIYFGLYRDWFAYVLLYLLLFGVASYGVLIRRRWGWVFQIPLSLNPGLWAVNSVYLSNRWREMP